MTRNFPEGNYVYIHIRNDSGKVFYVGRGTKYRGWAKAGRNKYWTNIFKKHGHTVEVVESGLSLDESKILEKMVIELALACDCVLANKTSGGDGVSGLIFDDESKIKMSRSQGGKRVYCSNGMSFDTGQKAAEWLQINGQGLALSGHISACARGERGSAWGYTWWYEGDDPKEYIPRYERMSISGSLKVYCSNGMVFRNAREAADWCVSQGHLKASRSGIEWSISERMFLSYGYAWWREGQDARTVQGQNFKKLLVTGTRVIMDDSVCFFNMKCAVDYIRTVEGRKAFTSSICVACNRPGSTALGHTWKYADE